MEERNPVDRLTGREKEALRLWLEHKTAKQIALDLGVSHFAVEKRLKSARLKLGLTSSLDAARLLAEAEGYGRVGAQSAEMVAATVIPQGWATSSIMTGAIAMSLLIAATLALLLQGQSSSINHSETQEDPAVLDSSAGEARLDRQESLLPGHVMPTTPEMRLMISTTFSHLDENGTGYLEENESPVRAPKEPQPVWRRDENGRLIDTGERVSRTQEELTAGFYEVADKDGDGRISLAEYEAWAVANFRQSGIPAEMQQAMNEPIIPQS